MKRIPTFVLGVLLVPLITQMGFGTLDLVTDDSGYINGAFFTVDQGRGGTGIFNTFVKLGNDDTEQGYNTSARPKGTWPDILDDVWSSLQHTYDIQLKNVPYLALGEGGIDYYEFALDINQVGAAKGDYLSLDRVILFTTTTGEQKPATISCFAIVRYDMDAAPDGDSNVLLDGRRFGSTGSGWYDMLMYVPTSCFDGAHLDDYVYLYSAFGAVGGEWAANDGQEEWRILKGFEAEEKKPPGVPEPASLLGLMMGVGSGLGMYLRRRRGV